MFRNQKSDTTQLTKMKAGLSILIADDDPDDLDLVRQALLSIYPNVQLHTASNGQEALVFLLDLTHRAPDLIILDLRMPKLDGRKTLAAIRSDKKLAHIPVVIYTTSQDVQDSIGLKEMGAVHFISKPSNPDEVYYLLSLVIEEYWQDIIA